MRLSLNARLGLVLGAALALGALATPAEAAPRARHARVARSADDHAMHRRARARASVQSRRRSAYYLLRTQRLVHWHIPERLERRQTNHFPDTDGAALQTSAAAVSGQDTLLVHTSLEPLGILSLPSCRIVVGGSVTPRSPRGPPLFRA
jgi:hypothetical protein